MIVKAIFCLLICFRINAQNLEIPVGTDYTSVQFKTSRTDIRFQESTTGKVVIIGIKDKSAWSFKKDTTGALVVEERDYENKLFASGNEPKERLQVRVPMLPLLIVGNEIEMNLESLRNNVKVIAIKGVIKGFKTQGELRFFLNAGEVHLDAHSGSLFLNGSQVKFSMKNSSGDIKVNNYAGSINLEKTTGHSNVFNYQGTIVLNQVTGSSQIELSKGSVQVSQSQGRHDIQTDEVNVKMKSGKLTFQSGGVTGTWLNLSSKEADLFLPSPLKPQRVKAEVFYKGRTSGEKSASRLEAKTVNAPIIVR